MAMVMYRSDNLSCNFLLARMRSHIVHAVLRAGLLMVILLLVAGCSGEGPTAPGGAPLHRWVSILAALNSPVPLSALDTSGLHGWMQVVNHRLADSLLGGPETSISLVAFLDDDEAVVRGLSVHANTVELRRVNSQDLGLVGYAYERDVSAGSMVRWHAEMAHDIGFSDSVYLPAYPQVSGLAQYDRLSASRGADVRIGGAAGGSRPLLVRLRYDDLRNRAAGGDTANVYLMEPRPPLVAELSVPDADVVTIPSSVLMPLPLNRVYMLTVMRYEYREGLNSAGGTVGMLAVASYEVPVMLRP